MSKRIKLYNRDLRVMAADSRQDQPDSMEQKLYTMRKEPNKISEGKLTEQYDDKYLQNDTEKVSIHMLNDDCLRHIFQFLSIRDRVYIEIVCKRWRDLSQDSWYMVKTLDISNYKYTWPTWRMTNTNTIPYTALFKILPKRGKFFTGMNLIHYPNYPFFISDVLNILNIVGNLCPNLTNIDVTASYINASGIRTLATNCKNITKLKLRPSTKCEVELEYLFKVHQNLEYLAITESHDISGKCLLCLPEHTVHTIILDYCDCLHDNLSMALKKLKNLQVLKITSTFEVTDDFLVHLVQHCWQLSSIDITGCRSVSDAGLMAIATLARLEKLAVNDIKQFTDDGLKNVCGLKEFECGGCPFSDRGIITLIKSSPQLQLLDLRLCERIGDATLDVAKDVCSSRTNNVILKMFVGGTRISWRKIDQEKIPPLLHIREWEL